MCQWPEEMCQSRSVDEERCMQRAGSTLKRHHMGSDAIFKSSPLPEKNNARIKHVGVLIKPYLPAFTHLSQKAYCTQIKKTKNNIHEGLALLTL